MPKKLRITQNGKSYDVEIDTESPSADCEFCSGSYSLATSIGGQSCLVHSSPVCAAYENSSASEFVERNVSAKEKRAKERIN